MRWQIPYLFFLMTIGTPHTGIHKRYSYRLPPSSIVTINALAYEKYAADNDRLICRTFHLNEARVRRIFSTYHLIDNYREVHDWYLIYQCSISGTIQVGNHIYKWSADPGNIVTTNWPDGKYRWLGGTRTDGPD